MFLGTFGLKGLLDFLLPKHVLHLCQQPPREMHNTSLGWIAGLSALGSAEETVVEAHAHKTGQSSSRASKNQSLMENTAVT